MSEEAQKIISEIVENSSDWRAQHSDLPVILLILSRVIRVWSSLKGNSNARDAWENLIKEGDSLATTRNLFVVAEAIGHLPESQKDREQGRIRDELAVVIENGENRHKVRALRALSFIASKECIPLLKKGLGGQVKTGHRWSL